jgi:tetratricopeptide (TPR) repeat protein
LPSARKEAVIIREQFPGNRPALQISTKTKDITLSFIQRNLRDYDVIHFAGHTKHHPTDRAKSGLVMKDGLLTIEDLKNLNPQEPMPSLVFSNSCQSAYDTADVYQSQPGEQVFGLADAFLLGGVRFFLGTLWKISDEDGGLFAREFYKYISEGSTIGSALRQARLASIERLGEDNMVWASYVLYGEPNRPIISDDHVFPGKQVINRLAKKAPLLGGIFLCVISGILIFMNSSELSAANIEKERTTIRQKYESEGLGKTFDYIRQTWNGRSAKDRYLQNIFLADVYALSSDYEQSLEAAQNALTAANQMRNKEKTAQAEFFLADKIKEKGLHLAIFFSLQKLPDDEFHQAIKLYEKQAARQTDLSKQAYAYKGIGDIYKTRNEYLLTLEYYQKAIDVLNKKKIINPQERASLANMQIDMARLYLEGDRNFEKAMDHLQSMGQLIRITGPKYQITPL